MSNQSVDVTFDALGEPVRRRIMELLRDGPLPVGRLAQALPVGRPAVSKHLKVLSDAGLIERRSVGTRNFYRVAPSGLAIAHQWLGSMWDRALADYADEVERIAHAAGQRTDVPESAAQPGVHASRATAPREGDAR